MSICGREKASVGHYLRILDRVSSKCPFDDFFFTSSGEFPLDAHTAFIVCDILSSVADVVEESGKLAIALSCSHVLPKLKHFEVIPQLAELECVVDDAPGSNTANHWQQLLPVTTE